MTRKQKKLRNLRIRLEQERIAWTKWHKNLTVKKQDNIK